MATTPPPPDTVRVPSTPRHGAEFDSHGRRPVRRSERLASQGLVRGRYSSPGLESSGLEVKPRSLEDGTTRRYGCTGLDGTFTEPDSPRCSPQKKQRKVTHNDVVAEEGRTQRLQSRTKGQRVTTSSSISSSRSLNNNNKDETAKQATKVTAGMLPTPAKTPRKKKVADAGRVSRSLFTTRSSDTLDSEDILPKKGKKFSHFSLESFNSDLEERNNRPALEVYTDSRDRIPMKSKKMNNLFWNREDAMEGVEHTGVTGRDKSAENGPDDEDGMWYVFRGKKVFRKFAPDPDTDDDDPSDMGLLANRTDLLDGRPMPRVRPLTRSSIKPRILFPTAEQTAAQNARREAEAAAVTKSVDQEVRMGLDSNYEVKAPHPVRALDDVFENPSTPPGKGMEPTTPPPILGSGRSLRSHTRKEMGMPVTPSREGEAPLNSPFDQWYRTKGPSTPGTGEMPNDDAKKRGANSVGSYTERENKKLRETRRTMT